MTDTYLTVEELNSLPNRSIVIDDDGDCWQKFGHHWIISGSDTTDPSDRVAGMGPRLIYRPDELRVSLPQAESELDKVRNVAAYLGVEMPEIEYKYQLDEVVVGGCVYVRDFLKREDVSQYVICLTAIAMFKDNPPKPALPLPTEAGTVIIATVRGARFADVKCMRTYSNPPAWVSSHRVEGSYYHTDKHITDWRYPEVGE